MNELRSAAYRLVTLLEDWLRGGFRRDHAPYGEPREPEVAPDAACGQTVEATQDTTHDSAATQEATHDSAETQEATHDSAATQDTTHDSAAGLQSLAREVSACTLCGLHRGRTRAVPGEGATQPLVLVVGEGPGADEDRTGRPFVGRAGQYLDKWLAAIGLDRARNCYIANVVKCRPPGNRDPLPEETSACGGYLKRQIALLRPRAVLTVGRISTQILTGRGEGIGQLRGRRHELDGLPLIATYHPSAVLRDTTLRAAVWEDLKLLRAVLQEQGIAVQA